MNVLKNKLSTGIPVILGRVARAPTLIGSLLFLAWLSGRTNGKQALGRSSRAGFRRHVSIPEDGNMHNYRCDYLKSHMLRQPFNDDEIYTRNISLFITMVMQELPRKLTWG
jgi:hypothetical protein